MIVRRAAVACVVAAGCGSSIDVVTMRPPRPARPAEEVELFVGQFPDQSFEVIGRIEARDVMAPSELRLMSRLRERGARLGCDGIIVERLGAHRDRHHATVLAGTCIGYLPPPGGSR